ncbi:hypothetical protein K493DRAFT_307882 [Basidiobolus meristosporus CBS 931.73]|uniref:Uncharacterized protein n=1 Tax=Basidiobolus meristosporus CBS 931.73 TaxID=1314790 RepID=A0A1Y1X8V0_9FUNG|nr:hypothetical protein K493DRAFT_307882 [Basidiobolus meristosporus CBS 931.73]|eukprot:ORX82157.1 hypothetical protein K493DRAFT_307882 [Basidiobolus meristosporus CBS 931.73]
MYPSRGIALEIGPIPCAIDRSPALKGGADQSPICLWDLRGNCVGIEIRLQKNTTWPPFQGSTDHHHMRIHSNLFVASLGGSIAAVTDAQGTQAFTPANYPGLIFRAGGSNAICFHGETIFLASTAAGCPADAGCYAADKDAATIRGCYRSSRETGTWCGRMGRELPRVESTPGSHHGGIGQVKEGERPVRASGWPLDRYR